MSHIFTSGYICACTDIKVRITHRIISFGQLITVALQKSILYDHSISDMLH